MSSVWAMPREMGVENAGDSTSMSPPPRILASMVMAGPPCPWAGEEGVRGGGGKATGSKTGKMEAPHADV